MVASATVSKPPRLRARYNNDVDVAAAGANGVSGDVIYVCHVCMACALTAVKWYTFLSEPLSGRARAVVNVVLDIFNENNVSISPQHCA